MCYQTVISTTSERELTEFNTPLVQFSRQLPRLPEESFLRHPHKWYLGSKDGCSCGFRHLDNGNEDLGFSEPVDWWPEEHEDIEATLEAVAVFKALLEEGAELDCVDAWTQDEIQYPKLHGEVVVNFAAIPDVCFRFFEGHRFEFTSGPRFHASNATS